MKVILQRDVKNLGRAHEEIETSDGHALNFLIPQKLAIAATEGARKHAGLFRAKAAQRGEVAAQLIRERLAYLGQNTLTVKKKANEQGHLYDALDAKEIALLAELPVEAIRIEKPFKELGTVEVPVALAEDFGMFTIVIEAE